MKTLSTLLAALTLCMAQGNAAEPYTVIANPGENACRSIRINWHTDTDDGKSYCTFTKRNDTNWDGAATVRAQQELCTAYYNQPSKTPDGKDFCEDARFLRNTATLAGLEPGTEYMYRVGDGSEIRYFKTAPANGHWTAGIISDFHAYTPLPKRVESAMGMIAELERQNGGEFDIMLHAGDICAWGGSYSFWRDLYGQSYFSKYVWAGVNGNHDNMDRKSLRLSNEYFRYANNNPQNGYDGQTGVCYHFKYGNALFIMLNNESMRSEEGLAAAQEWVRKTIRRNPSRFVIVMEHYQWFFGNNGKTSQYGRWHSLFDECGVDLAIAGNNHIYARTNAVFHGKETDGSRGTVYLQTTSSDNGRGRDLEEWTDNKDLIKFRWTEGAHTVSAVILDADDDKLRLTLYDRNGTALDSVTVKAKKPF